MSVATRGRETTAEQARKRMVAALTEMLVVVEDGHRSRGVPGMVTVYSADGTARLVDIRDGNCDCEDMRWNHPKQCKHLLRAELALGRRPVPPWVDNHDRLDYVLRQRLAEDD